MKSKKYDEKKGKNKKSRDKSSVVKAKNTCVYPNVSEKGTDHDIMNLRFKIFGLTLERITCY